MPPRSKAAPLSPPSHSSLTGSLSCSRSVPQAPLAAPKKSTHGGPSDDTDDTEAADDGASGWCLPLTFVLLCERALGEQSPVSSLGDATSSLGDAKRLAG